MSKEKSNNEGMSMELDENCTQPIKTDKDFPELLDVVCKKQLMESNKYEISSDKHIFTHSTGLYMIYFGETIQIIGFKGEDYNGGGGYLYVEYHCGEPSYNEISAFEKRYIGTKKYPLQLEVTEEKMSKENGFDFSKALARLKLGERVCRDGWTWAELIVAGIKDIENRTWSTKYRGEFLIHASRNFDLESYVQMWHEDSSLPDSQHKFQKGGIIGIATLVDCVKDHPSQWKVPSQFGFVLENARRLDFIPLKGQLGFFNYNGEI